MSTSTPRPQPTPMVHGGRPPGGKHVESAVPGCGPYDFSGAVGSNVVAAPGPDADSDEVLPAPPWIAVNEGTAQWDPPLS